MRSKNQPKPKEKKVKKQSPLGIIKKTISYTIPLLGWIFFSIYTLRKLKQHGILQSKLPFEESINATFNTIVETFNQWNETYYGNHSSDSNQQYNAKRPGYILSKNGAKVKHPVVMIPGFTSSMLEVWSTTGCGNVKFRQGLWADTGMLTSFFRDSTCWKDHLSLDPFTGMDPANIKIRSAEGMKGADYFMAIYWVWAKIIQNLALVGYTPSEMRLMPYDWRLAFSALEKRDGYFSELKSVIEFLHKKTGEKVVLMGHSMGGLVSFYFFNFVTKEDKDWVEEHVHAFVDIASPLLGVSKAVSALLSGEMSDTASVIGLIGYGMEQSFGRKKRRDIWTTWGSLWSMLPKGGDRLFSIGADLCKPQDRADGNDPFCPSDTSLSPFIQVVDDVDTVHEKVDCSNEEVCKPDSLAQLVHTFRRKTNHLTTDIIKFLNAHGGGLGPNTASAKFHSQFGDESSPRTWHDPTTEPLPYAPSMKFYCLYGVGIPTERAYYYKRNYEDGDQDPTIVIDSTVTKDDGRTKYGSRYSDGDGSVNLLSLGYLCADAWKREETSLNPSNMTVITREYKHNPTTEITLETIRNIEDRTGPGSSDHIDIMGNYDMISDIIRIVTAFDPITESKIYSDIERIAKEINDHLHGGL